MTPFATTDQIKARIGIKGTDLDPIIEELALGVTAEIERIAGRRLRRESREERYNGGGEIIRLSLSPVREITHIREALEPGTDLTDPSDYTTLTPYADYILEPGEKLGYSGIIRRINGVWAGNDSTHPGMIEIYYAGGYSPEEEEKYWPTPADLISACITQVAHELEQRQSPGRIASSLRGVAIASGTSVMHQVMNILPSVETVAMSYRRFV